jgi:hypothetical protein
MPTEDERAYYERRVRDERKRAELATDPIAGKLHTDMARRYVQRLMRLKA